MCDNIVEINSNLISYLLVVTYSNLILVVIYVLLRWRITHLLQYTLVNFQSLPVNLRHFIIIVIFVCALWDDFLVYLEFQSFSSMCLFMDLGCIFQVDMTSWHHTRILFYIWEGKNSWYHRFWYVLYTWIQNKCIIVS